jgi:8-oxo-dGTP pyrophosphatase MutT (NUDIX family)
MRTENNNWKRISKESVFKTRIFDLHMEKSECLRTGAIQNFYYIQCVDWVNVIALTPDSSIVMIRQFRHGSGNLEIEVPGGGIDQRDTDPIAAGARELMEETGYSGENGRIIGKVCPNPALQNNFCFTVMFDNCVKKSEPFLEDTEVIETELVSIPELEKLVTGGHIRHGLVLNAIHFFELERRKQ